MPMRPAADCYRPGSSTNSRPLAEHYYDDEQPKTRRNEDKSVRRTDSQLSATSLNLETFNATNRPRASPSIMNFAASDDPYSPDNFKSSTSTRRQSFTNEFKIRGAGRPLEALRPHLDSSNDVIMASPTDLSRHDSHVGRSGKSTSQAPTLDALTTAASGSTVDFESFMKAFSHYTQSVVETATIQVRCEALKHDEQQQIGEHDRWSKYFGSFIAIDEDQARGLTAIKRTKDHAQKQLDQAHKEADKAKDCIAKTIFAATTGRRIVDLDSETDRQTWKEASSDMIRDLKEEIASLKQDISGIRKRQDCEIGDLQRKYPSSKVVHEIENKLEKKISKEAERITGLADVAAKNVELKKDLLKMEDKQIQNAVKSEIEKFSESFATRLGSQREDFKNDTELAQTKTIGLFRSELKSELEKLSDMISTKSASERSNDLDVFQAKEKESRQSELKSETERLERLISTNSSTIASLEPQLSAFGECVDSFTGFRNTVENTIQNVKRDSASREKVVKNLESEQQAQNSAIQHLTEQLDESSRKVNGSIHGLTESCQREHNQRRVEQTSLKVQLESQETITEELRKQLSATLSGHRGQSQTPIDENGGQLAPSIHRLESDIEKRYRLLSRRLDERQHVEDAQDLYMKEHVEEMNNLHIMLKADLSQLTADVKILNEGRYPGESDQSSISTSLEQLNAEVKILRANDQGQVEQCTQLCTTLEKLLADVKTLSETMQGNKEKFSLLDQLRSDNVSSSTYLENVKAELAKLQETVGSSSERLLLLEQLQSEVPGLQAQPKSNRPRSIQPSPHQSPRVNGFNLPQGDEVKPKLEALETKVDYFEHQVTDKVKSIESFVAAQESRFNNLTTEPMVRSVVNHMQQLYPAPATLSRRQDHLEGYYQQLYRMIEVERETAERKTMDVRKSLQELFDASTGSMRTSVNELRQEIRANFESVERSKIHMNLKLQHLEQRITTDGETTTAQPDRASTTLMQDHSNSLQEFRTRLDLLEQKQDRATVDVRAGDQAHEILKCGRDLNDCKEKVAGTQELKVDIERLQLEYDELISKVDSGAQNLAKEIESLKQNVEDSNNKTDTQGKIIKEVYDVALKRVESLYIRVIALEGSNASSQGDHVPAVVADTNQEDVHRVSSESDCDANPVKPTIKRVRESPSLNGSMEEQPKKKRRGRPSRQMD
ncbi:MAG: hypothetical protein Q9224_002043 [Gallowayella concinna]